MPATVTNVSVTSAATLILSANAARQELHLVNNSVSPDCFIGPDNTVTATTGLTLFAGGSKDKDRGFGLWLGPVWGITSSGTADVRVWETSR